MPSAVVKNGTIVFSPYGDHNVTTFHSMEAWDKFIAEHDGKGPRLDPGDGSTVPDQTDEEWDRDNPPVRKARPSVVAAEKAAKGKKTK